MSLFEHAIDGGAHEDGLIEQQLHIQGGGQRGADARQDLLDLGDDGERGGATVFQHGQERGAVAVVAHDVRLDGVAVAHMADVADVYGGAVGLLDGQAVECFGRGRQAVEPHHEFVGTDFGSAGGDDQALRIDGVDYVVGREPLRIERFEVDIHHDLAGPSAIGQGKAGALHGSHLGADEVVAVIIERRLAHGVARNTHLQDGNAGGVIAQDGGRSHAGGQGVQDGLGGGGQLRDGGIHLGAGMEEDLDDRQTGEGLRLHVLDVVDRGGEGALAADGDDFGHFFGGDAGVGPDDADDGDVDFGEDVGGHAEGGEDAQDDDHYGHDHEGVGAAEG